MIGKSRIPVAVLLALLSIGGFGFASLASGGSTPQAPAQAYRCVVFLEPIRPGEQFSRASDPLCSDGPILSVNGVPLASSYLITKFWDRTDYRTLLVEYYGATSCLSASYGVADLPDSLDNKFESGRAYSDCRTIYVYDFNNYGGPSYSCGPNCPTFYALNNFVSSWRAIH